ncbi:DUF6111 family protein [Segnochrobactrum spirostomi]|uniref:Uncharacterized protein n=1 Tax=Segnochrobactrum spirostomi TaxID=2608987 RepID=A0A6A7Y2K4_9HYPH|nr:DUF6111 family protein [Segnochrobactrum spirostomi]MQT12528.1 hypothetical protein [Segnochrobactrum spirostomi]
MLRLSLIEIALFLLPFVAYGLYLALRVRPVDPASAARGRVLLNLILIGLLFVVAGFAVVALEVEPGVKGTYHPAEVRDGVLVPGHIE